MAFNYKSKYCKLKNIFSPVFLHFLLIMTKVTIKYFDLKFTLCLEENFVFDKKTSNSRLSKQRILGVYYM